MYGVRIKNPDFSGIGFDYRGNDMDEQIMVEKAKLCALALKLDKSTGAFFNTNDIKYVVNSIRQYLIIKCRKKFESWVENDILYLDEVKQNQSEYELEDSVNTFESFILDDLEMMYIIALMNNHYFSEENKDGRTYPLEIYDIIDKVRVEVNKIVDTLKDSVEIYVANKIVQLNFDKIISEKELTKEDLENEE